MARNVWTGQYASSDALPRSTAGMNARGLCLHKPDTPRTKTKGHRKIADPTASEAIARADAKLGNRPVDIQVQRNLRFRPAPPTEEERIMNATRKAEEESARLKEQAAELTAKKATGKTFDGFAALAAAVGTEAIEQEATNIAKRDLAWS